MKIRVDHYQTLSMKTHKVVNVFEQYKKNLVPWNIFFQIMTHIYLCIRVKIFTGSLLLKHTIFF